MKHKTIQNKLLSYLDDELPEREKIKVQSHLKSCRICQEALKTVELIWATERPIERKTAPLILWTRISTRLNSEKKQGILYTLKQFIRPALRPVMTVVVLLFIFFSGIKLGKLITGSFVNVTEKSTESIADNFGMSYFEISPPGSIDAHILALTESEM